MYELQNARALAQDYLSRHIEPGDSVVDATMGNGGDTEFLCHLVGEEGRVYAIDIQQQALEATKARLIQTGLLDRVQFSLEGHAKLSGMIHEQVSAVMFNLGWLPGGDHNITTKTATTISGLREAVQLLRPLGMVTVCIYPGHEEGMRELIAVGEFCAELPVQKYTVLRHDFINAKETTPRLFVIQRNHQG